MKETTKNNLKAFKNNCKSFFVSIINFLKNTKSPIDQIDLYLLSGIGFITHGVAQLFGHYSFIICGVLLISLGLLSMRRPK